MEFVLKHIQFFCIIIFLSYIFEPENEALTGCWRLLFNNGRVTVDDDVDEDIHLELRFEGRPMSNSVFPTTDKDDQ